MSSRKSVRSSLAAMGLLTPVRRLKSGMKRGVRLIAAPDQRRQQQELEQFVRTYAGIFEQPVTRLTNRPRALIVGRPGITIEGHLMLFLSKAIERAGFQPVALLLPEDKFFAEYHRIAGIEEINFWSPLNVDHCVRKLAKETLANVSSIDDLLKIEYRDVGIGKATISTALRESQGEMAALLKDRKALLDHLAKTISSTIAAHQILDETSPSLVVSIDLEYTPKRELLDASVARGVTVLACYRSHRNNALMLKRHTSSNHTDHPSSLSDKSWRQLTTMSFTEEMRRELHEELRRCYSSDDWWGIPLEHVQSNSMPDIEIRNRLGLTNDKKSAFIFPHVPWDASVCWGHDLFVDYQQWFTETVRAAIANPVVNWVIKIHPSNVLKSTRTLAGLDAIELDALRSLGPLPEHIRLLPPETPISTLRLFQVMDYCLTVRGTVGIEAACFGIPVLTGGTGRYDRRGFTIDSDSTSEYLDRLRRIHEIPRLTPDQKVLAERFAYGLLILRPLPLQSITLKSRLRAGTRSSINIRSTSEWGTALDINSAAEWLRDTDHEDFLMPLPQPLPGTSRGFVDRVVGIDNPQSHTK